jgi:predicted Zn-ribbon and HTH transcriptional regulator
MKTLARPTHELADIVRMYGDAFIDLYHPLKQHLRVLNAIRKCRTAALGGHLDKCDACGHERFSYNSCRNRHCPKCQGTNRERWIIERQKDLLPVPYFHVVFTLPEPLNALCLAHPSDLYSILFRASRDTMAQLGQDTRHLGAATGMIAVLHTWGQQLWLHPHVHCIVPGGGITKAGYWKHCKSKGNYLFPAKVMSSLFRGKFMAMLRAFCRRRKIPLGNDWCTDLYRTQWVVYAKPVFARPQQVIEYLGRYTHRIAISNHRLLATAQGQVSFTYKDYRQAGVKKTMTLQANEFLRRFCLHILPPGFMKIRHYGILASRAKPRLKEQQQKMGVLARPVQRLDWKEIARTVLHFDPDACPICKAGRMKVMAFLEPEGRSPPWPIVQPCSSLHTT